tara:strand:+ start:935 stop:1330 length:396 start_codon:yes stop_codon:yes gene_type:complete
MERIDMRQMSILQYRKYCDIVEKKNPFIGYEYCVRFFDADGNTMVNVFGIPHFTTVHHFPSGLEKIPFWRLMINGKPISIVRSWFSDNIKFDNIISWKAYSLDSDTLDNLIHLLHHKKEFIPLKTLRSRQI